MIWEVFGAEPAQAPGTDLDIYNKLNDDYKKSQNKVRTVAIAILTKGLITSFQNDNTTVEKPPVWECPSCGEENSTPEVEEQSNKPNP